MALGNFQCWGVDGRARTYSFAICVGKGCLTVFSLVYQIIFLFFLSLGDGSI